MTNIQAAIGLAQLENIEQHLASRRRVAEWYNQHLRRAAAFIELPVEMPWAHHSFWMYTILLRTTAAGMSNERFREALAARGIDSRPVFYPMHTMPPYSEDRCYPVAEDLSARGLNLPTHGHLTEDDVQYIGDAIFSICSQAACA
jgi:perosamine synthetase